MIGQPNKKKTGCRGRSKLGKACHGSRIILGRRLPQFHQTPNRARTLSRAATFESVVLFWSGEFRELSSAASHAHGRADWAISAEATV